MTVRVPRIRLDPPPGGKLVRDWLGKRVVTLVEMRNGMGVIPAGTVCTVENPNGGTGLQLRTARCSCCGLSMFISRVSHREVRLANADEYPSSHEGTA